MTTPSTKPVPSNLAQDLLFNAEKLDEGVNSSSQTYRDRFGVDRLTAQGAVDTFRALNPRGAWATGTTYAARDLVSNGGSWYLALDGHTAGATFAGDLNAHWRPFQVNDGSVTLIFGNGVTDNSTQVALANAAGRPICPIGILHVPTPTTITVPLVNVVGQCFSILSQVTIANGQPVRPEWFGSVGSEVGVVRRAVDALPNTGGVVSVGVASYRTGYDTALPSYFDNRGGTPGVDYMVKPNVRIQGARLPSFKTDNTALVNGSILKGTFYVASEATGFQADLIGVDVGSAVCASLYGGADADGFCMLQANKGAPVYGNYFRIGSVVTLGPGGSTLGHGFLLESVDGGSVDYVESRLHYHGAVIKSRNIKCGTLAGTLNSGEEVLVKSDYYANMDNVSIDKVIGTGNAAGGSSGYGFQVLADAASGSSVSVGQVIVDNHTIGVQMTANGANTLADVNIGEMIVRSCPTGYRLSGANLKRTNVSRALINNFTSAVVVDTAVTSKDNGIDSINMAVGTNGIDVDGRLRVGDVYAEQLTYAFYHRTDAAKIYHAGGFTAGTGVANFWRLTPALLNSWVNFGSNDFFSVASLGGRISMSGLIRGGTTTTICTLPPAARPGANLRFPCVAFNGSVLSMVELLIVAATGDVSISSLSAASNYLSLRGVSWEIPF